MFNPTDAIASKYISVMLVLYVKLLSTFARHSPHYIDTFRPPKIPSEQLFVDFMMTTRKGGTKNYKSNHQTNVDKYMHYYGDDNFLKTDEYEKEKNIFDS